MLYINKKKLQHIIPLTHSNLKESYFVTVAKEHSSEKEHRLCCTALKIHKKPQATNIFFAILTILAILNNAYYTIKLTESIIIKQNETNL